MPDTYKSIYESFIHAGTINECRVKLCSIHSEKLELKWCDWRLCRGCDGILVAPGFGERASRVKLKYKMVGERKIPIFGYRLGMQCAGSEFGKRCISIKDSAYWSKSKTNNPIIHLVPDQIAISNKGGTMRLGAYKCKLVKREVLQYGSMAKQLIEERHSANGINNEYLNEFETTGTW